MLRWLLVVAAWLIPSSLVAGPREEALARDVFLLAYPATETMRTLESLERRAQANGRSVLNTFLHRSSLAGPMERQVTAPNNDTLYSTAWLDVSKGPVMLIIPPLPGRYHSVALLDLFTDNQAVLGTRVNGSHGGRYWLAGPNWRGTVPAGSTLVRLQVDEAWIIARVLVDGPADLAAATVAQRKFSLEPSVPTTARLLEAPSPLPADAAAFLDRVNAILARGPLPPVIARRAKDLQRAGINPGAPGAFARLSPALQQAWRAGIAVFEPSLRGGLTSVGETRQGWVYPAQGLGRFGTDWLYRSRIALAGLGALPIEEATYLTAVADAAGADLEGEFTYRLRVPADVPVDAFWSLTMYQREDDGRTFLVDNPIDRYSIGNRTQGVTRNGDGSIDVVMSRTPPADGTANWLPTPTGPFRVSFRAYLPRAPFIEGQFSLPAIERLP